MWEGRVPNWDKAISRSLWRTNGCSLLFLLTLHSILCPSNNLYSSITPSLSLRDMQSHPDLPNLLFSKQSYSSCSKLSSISEYMMGSHPQFLLYSWAEGSNVVEIGMGLEWRNIYWNAGRLWGVGVLVSLNADQ